MKPRDRTRYEYCFQAVGSSAGFYFLHVLPCWVVNNDYIAAQAETVQETTYESKLGVSRFAADAIVVSGFKIWDLYSLGSVLRTSMVAQRNLCRMVLACEGWTPSKHAAAVLDQIAVKEFHQRVYGEEFDYRDFRPLFTCELFQPEQWAKIFKRSGARYVVLTSKHHDGYCLWPSKEATESFGTAWNSVESGPHRDLVGDLTRAVRAEGLKMGLYYSIWDWFNPYWPEIEHPYTGKKDESPEVQRGVRNISTKSCTRKLRQFDAL